RPVSPGPTAPAALVTFPTGASRATRKARKPRWPSSPEGPRRRPRPACARALSSPGSRKARGTSRRPSRKGLDSPGRPSRFSCGSWVKPGLFNSNGQVGSAFFRYGARGTGRSIEALSRARKILGSEAQHGLTLPRGRVVRQVMGVGEGPQGGLEVELDNDRLEADRDRAGERALGGVDERRQRRLEKLEDGLEAKVIARQSDATGGRALHRGAEGTREADTVRSDAEKDLRGERAGDGALKGHGHRADPHCRAGRDEALREVLLPREGDRAFVDRDAEARELRFRASLARAVVAALGRDFDLRGRPGLLE